MAFDFGDAVFTVDAALNPRSSEAEWRAGISQHASESGGKHLILEFSWGALTAIDCQRLTKLACDDGARGVISWRIATTGTMGQNKQNCHRELIRICEKLLGGRKFESSICKLPMVVTRGEDIGPQPVMHGYIDPHEWFSFLCHKFPDTWHRRFLGTGKSETRPIEWDAEFFNTRAIPIGLHGDGAPVIRILGLMSIVWYGLLGAGSTDDVLNLISCYFGELEVGNFHDYEGESTKDTFWKRIIWSLKALLGGKFPYRDWGGKVIVGDDRVGKDLADGFFWQVIVPKGDMEFLVNHIGVPGHWSSNSPCLAREATKIGTGAMAWNNWDPDAPWRDTVFMSKAKWREHCIKVKKDVHLLFREADDGGLGLHPFVMMRGAMHCVDLGDALHVAGNVLFHMCYSDMIKANDPAGACDWLWKEISKIYKAERTPTRFSFLDLAFFTAPDRPMEKAPLLKGHAAETRHLIPILDKIFKVKHRPKNQYEHLISKLLSSLTMIYKYLDTNDGGEKPFYLDETKVVKPLRQNIDFFLQAYQECQRMGKLLHDRADFWHEVPKFHGLWHVGFEAQFMNPDVAKCYINEDFQQRMKGLGASVRHGSIAAKRSAKICSKWVYGALFRIVFSSEAVRQ
ncbi:unnamed protein product [Prorocentrum cordatum]|uniref:Uncharacterized protein n=1 Tax=Prorocentrum cordatum TaxID=2364126 RepID=A0ABN9WAG7_9DINO|nr:unnamed protein product [Polarella glacialis]